jgi:hypothetical protein
VISAVLKSFCCASRCSSVAASVAAGWINSEFMGAPSKALRVVEFALSSGRGRPPIRGAR